MEEIFSNAELALASYSTFHDGNTDDQLDELVSSDGMSAKQDEEFARRYPTVVTQYNDTDTSLSATVFKDTAGNLTLAIRGTLELVGSPSDLSTDTDIALRGAGYDQIVALYNWWQRASTLIGQDVPQYAIQSSLVGAEPEGAVLLYMASSGPNLERGIYLVRSASQPATGELVNEIASDPDLRLAVTGHSLGGHLAMAFGALFSDVAGQITTFNAPGFIDNTTNQSFFPALGGSVPTGVNTTNVIADEAGVGEVPWDAIAGLHGELGTVIRVPIENQWLSGEPNPSGARNHSQQTLTHALAVYALLDGLDSTFTSEAFRSILDSATGHGGQPGADCRCAGRAVW